MLPATRLWSVLHHTDVASAILAAGAASRSSAARLHGGHAVHHAAVLSGGLDGRVRDTVIMLVFWLTRDGC